MKTYDLSEYEILSALRSTDHITSEDFFKQFPSILYGGEPAKAFGLKLRALLNRQLIETTRNTMGIRYWRLSMTGKNALDMTIKDITLSY